VTPEQRAGIEARDAAFGPVVGDPGEEADDLPEGWESVVVAEGHKDFDQPATDRRILLAALAEAGQREAALDVLLGAAESVLRHGNGPLAAMARDDLTDAVNRVRAARGPRP
jgi:hypothetical protein